MKFISNKAGIARLDNKGKRVPVSPKPTTGRTIGQNLAITQTCVKKAASHDSVLSGGVRG